MTATRPRNQTRIIAALTLLLASVASVPQASATCEACIEYVENPVDERFVAMDRVVEYAIDTAEGLDAIEFEYIKDPVDERVAARMDRAVEYAIDLSRDPGVPGPPGNGPGQITMKCSIGGFVCATASAHAEREELSHAPDPYSHMTSGSGFNPNGLSGGQAVITTSLGSLTCNFGAGGGCGGTWSNAAWDCIPQWANTVATAVMQASTRATDYNCN